MPIPAFVFVVQNHPLQCLPHTPLWLTINICFFGRFVFGSKDGAAITEAFIPDGTAAMVGSTCAFPL